MADFKSINIQNNILFRKHSKTKNQIYWQKFKSVCDGTLNDSITSIEFCDTKSQFPSSTEMTPLTISAGKAAYIFREKTEKSEMRFSRFKMDVFTTTLRKDQKLLAAAGAEKEVKLFDAENKELLRVFKGHTDAVRVLRYPLHKFTSILSFSDDKSIVEWDIPLKKRLVALENAHADCIRAGEQNSETPSQWFSGGRDGVVRLWDFREKRKESVQTMRVPFPVERIKLMDNGGSLLFTCGETFICAFDHRMPWKELHRSQSHHKLVTDLSFDARSGQLVSASLDQHVKMHDLNSFEVVFKRRFDAAVCAVDVSEEGRRLAVGLSDGKYCVLGLGKGSEESRKVFAEHRKGADFVSGRVIVYNPQKRRRIRGYEKDLSRFRYKQAVSHLFGMKSNPNSLLAGAFFRELIERNALSTAMSERDPGFLMRVMKTFVKNFDRVESTAISINVLWGIIEIYGEELKGMEGSREVISWLKVKVEKEIELQKKLTSLRGVIESVLEY